MPDLHSWATAYKQDDMLDGIFVKQGCILKSDLNQSDIRGHYSQSKMAPKMAVKHVFSILKRHDCLLIALKWSYLLEN